jgi:TolB protein
MFRCIAGVALLAITQSVSAAPRNIDVAYLAVVNGLWQVWVMNDDGSGRRQVTHSMSDKTRVSWFPSGDRLLISTNQGLVLTVDLKSGKEIPVEIGVAPVLDAVASPDGTHIAFSFNGADSGDGNDIWMAAADGTGRVRLTDMPSLQHEPTWSPDGKSLLFLSGNGKQVHDIWKIDLSTRSREQLTAGDLYHFDIAISATGELAYSANRSGNYEIYVQTPGKEPVQITHDPGLDAHPTFSPDGREILFESTRGGQFDIWKFNRVTHSSTQATHQKNGARAPAWRLGMRGGAT